jgi:CRP/FNR family cyclic AMP-dependent transcriptional regulator
MSERMEPAKTSAPLYRRFHRRGPAAPRPDREGKLRYLEEAEFFKGMSAEDLSEVERMTTMSTCRRGRVFFTPGETGEVLFILKRGRVQLYRVTPEGRKLILTTLGPGAVFGEMALVGQRMYGSFAEAVEDCTLCVMSRADVERFIMTKPLFALRLVELIGRRLIDAEERLERFVFRSVPSRLAAAILELAAGREEVSGFSHQDLADFVGTYRETATRVLNEFRAAGFIDLARTNIVIRDAGALRRIAEAG